MRSKKSELYSSAPLESFPKVYCHSNDKAALGSSWTQDPLLLQNMDPGSHFVSAKPYWVIMMVSFFVCLFVLFLFCFFFVVVVFREVLLYPRLVSNYVAEDDTKHLILLPPSTQR